VNGIHKFRFGFRPASAKKTRRASAGVKETLTLADASEHGQGSLGNNSANPEFHQQILKLFDGMKNPGYRFDHRISQYNLHQYPHHI
jgi:hypothetical protein